MWGCVAIGALHLTATCWAAPLADKFGRRPLLLASWGGMAACLFTSAIITFFQDLQNHSSTTPPLPRESRLQLCLLALVIDVAVWLDSTNMGSQCVYRHPQCVLHDHQKAYAVLLGAEVAFVACLPLQVCIRQTIHKDCCCGVAR